MNTLSRITSFLAARGRKEPAPDPVSAGLYNAQAFDAALDLLTKIPEMDEVLAQAGMSRYTLSKLETDDDIYGALRTRREAVVSTPWKIETEDEGLRALLTEELTPMIDGIVAGAWKAVPYGYSVIEAVYKVRDDGRIGWDTVMVKPMQWFDPRPSGEVRYSPPSGGATTTVDTRFKFFLTRSDWSYERPHGQPLLAKVYWPWFFRFNAWRFWAQFLERFGQPLLYGKSSKPAAMASALLQAHQDAVIGIGTQDEIGSVSPTTEGGAFQNLEDCIVRRYQKLILGQTLTTDTAASGGGSYALGAVHAEVKEGLRRSDLRLVNRTVQRCIEAIRDLNGIDSPVRVIFDDGVGLARERADRDQVLYNQGIRWTPDYISKNYDLPAEMFTITEPATPTTVEKKVALKASESEFAKRRANDPKRFTPAQQLVEDETLAASALGGPIDKEALKNAVFASTDVEDLERRLGLLMQGADEEAFGATLSQALFTADLIGYLNADGKV